MPYPAKKLAKYIFLTLWLERSYGRRYTLLPQILPMIRKYSALGNSLCNYKRCWKWCPLLISASNTESVSRNFLVSLWTALRLYTRVSGNFSANFSCTKLVYISTYRGLSAHQLSENTLLYISRESTLWNSLLWSENIWKYFTECPLFLFSLFP
jgi:hypothetical protein